MRRLARSNYFNNAEEVAAEVPRPAAAAPRKQKGLGLGKDIAGSLDLLSTVAWGSLGFYGTSVIHQTLETTFLNTWGLMVTESLSVAIVYGLSHAFLDDKKSQRNILIGSLINVGIQLLKAYLPKAVPEIGVSGVAGYVDQHQDRLMKQRRFEGRLGRSEDNEEYEYNQ